jgi:alpha-1,3-glucosyltransferase
MWPLLVRDGQALQYVTVTLLWNYVIGYSPLAVEDVLLRTFGLVRHTLPPSRLSLLALRPSPFFHSNMAPPL